MDIRQNPMWLSVPVGRYFRTDVRVSVWLLLFGLIFVAQLGARLGLLVFAILFFSILLHEFGHVFAARRTRGSGNEILLWPLGGLAQVIPAPNFYSEFWTVIAGPAVNFLICLLCLPAIVTGTHLWECLSLLTLPPVALTENFPQALLWLVFNINFKLLVLNMLPIYPLDGGQLSFHIAKLSWDRQTAKVGSLWVGMVLAVILTAVGWFVRSPDLLFLGFVLLLISTYEHLVAQISRPLDDSFMGYDFSQGYTSLEGREDQAVRQPGVFERWKMERAQRKQEKDLQVKIETERRVDELLDKVHQQGMSSLTEAERRFLQRASGQYRSPGKE